MQEKDAQLENLRRCLTELKEKVAKAEPLMRLGSPDKLAALAERNVSVREEASMVTDMFGSKQVLVVLADMPLTNWTRLLRSHQ